MTLHAVPNDDANGQQTLMPAETCVDALIAAQGNSSLAAERLGITTQVLIASIAADPSAQSSLNAQLRTLTTLMTFDSLRAAKNLLDDALMNMEPSDFAKLYTQLIDKTAQLTDDKTSTQNVNVTEVVLRMLPPEARRALLSLAGTESGVAAPGSAPFPPLSPYVDDDDGG